MCSTELHTCKAIFKTWESNTAKEKESAQKLDVVHEEKEHGEATLFKEGDKSCGLCSGRISTYKAEIRLKVNEQRKLFALLTTGCEICECDMKSKEQAHHKHTKTYTYVKQAKQAEHNIALR